MASRTSEYWEQRSLQLEEAQHNKAVEYYHDLSTVYDEAARKTQQELIPLYNKLAANNGVSMAEAKKMLTTNELKEFRWTVDEYIKYGKENAISGAWMKELENASLRYRISRLEAMKVQMQHHAECVMAKEADGMTKMLSDMYTEGYYKTGHMVQTGLGVGHSFAQVDRQQVDKVLSRPWAPDGKNFSERIWGQHRPQLVNDLHKGLSQMIARGESPDKLIQMISEKYNVSKKRAGNLVMTEAAYFSAKADQDSFKELDVEEQQFCATLDSHTSPICRDMDGQVIATKDVIIGTNAPPLHCRCRSVMTPYFEDNITSRMARNEEGKSERIPEDLSYHEWEEKYVKGNGVSPKPEPEPKTLKEKVDSIKSDVTEKRQHVSEQKKTIDTKKHQRAEIQDDIDTLETERIEIQVKQEQYDRLKDRDFDSEIAEKLKEQEQHAARVQQLEETNHRYYDRPERGTPEREAWREWRKTVNYEELFDELVDEKSKLSRAEIELKTLTDQKAQFAKLNIDSLNKQLGKVDDALVSKRTTAAQLADDIVKATDDIDNTLVRMEADIKQAGKAFIDDLPVDKLTDANYAELRARRAELAKKCNAFSKKHGYTAEWHKLYDEYKKVDEAWKNAMDSFTPNADIVRAKLAEVRSVGASNADDLLKVHLNNTRSVVKGSVVNGYDYYPTDWVDESIKHSKISLKKTDRGYYSDHRLELAISGEDANKQFRTAIHELGHRFEHVIDGITDVERIFYERRTRGEALQWLGQGYKKHEVSRFDDFLDKYMGKEYHDDFYELVSMGFEMGYTDPLTLLKDEDMAQLIYGILTTQ